MQGFQLIFSTLQNRQHQGESMVDWLIGVAKSVGAGGISVFNASKGFGRDGVLHSANFFELADQPVEIVMVVDEMQCEKLFKLLSQTKPSIFYTKTAIEYGTL
ncbi:MAG: DUF190 domain-containing protein [Sulfurospirillaceae bacterium]|nr:DUF190 domain-containing protein [Sulfurospirillaceae bacterium]MDD3463236.1 DUF190 domain-containing protein [Sulfurospirillaceae bacterium]